jgi:type IV secretory pathway VirB10-like protein
MFDGPGRSGRPLSKTRVALIIVGVVVLLAAFVATAFWSGFPTMTPTPVKPANPLRRQPAKDVNYVALPLAATNGLEPQDNAPEKPPSGLPIAPGDDLHQKILQTQQGTNGKLDVMISLLQQQKPPATTPKATEADQRTKRKEAEREAEERKEKFRKRRPQWLDAEKDKAPALNTVKHLRTRWSLTPNTIIPILTEAKISNEAPGPSRAIVSEDVKDSETQTITVLPQGAMIGLEPTGKTILGDTRLPMKSTKLSYRGRYLLMPPAGVGDREGTSGFGDLVDRHPWRIVGLVLATALLRLGSSISVSGGSGGMETGIHEQLAGNVGQEASQEGTREVRQYLRTDPTLVVRPSYQGSIILTEPLELSQPLIEN